MKKKKILAVLIMASALTSFTACSQPQPKNPEDLSTSKNEALKTQTEPYTNSDSEKESTNIADNKTSPANKNKRKSKTQKNKSKTSSTNKKSEDIRPELKEVLDSYEAYMDEYCSFMKKYADSNYDSSMLVEYSNMMIKYAEFTEKIDALQDEEMNDAEANYYINITLKVSQKLLEATQ